MRPNVSRPSLSLPSPSVSSHSPIDGICRSRDDVSNAPAEVGRRSRPMLDLPQPGDIPKKRAALDLPPPGGAVNFDIPKKRVALDLPPPSNNR